MVTATVGSDTAASAGRDGARTASRAREASAGEDVTSTADAPAAETTPALRALQESLDLRDQGHVADL